MLVIAYFTLTIIGGLFIGVVGLCSIISSGFCWIGIIGIFCLVRNRKIAVTGGHNALGRRFGGPPSFFVTSTIVPGSRAVWDVGKAPAACPHVHTALPYGL